MIRVVRTTKPATLTPQEVADLTAQFAVDSTLRVWDRTDVKQALLAMSAEKCVYCECRIAEESKYMEVDHFRNKNDHPHLVVEWLNLLPSCKRCNVRKGHHNVDVDGMIVDPTIVNPSDHLWLRTNYRLRHKDGVGQSTISALDLNHSQRVVLKRFEIAQSVSEALEAIRAKVEVYIVDPEVRGRRTRLLNSIRNVLDEAASDREYSATAATEILRSEDFAWIKQTLEARGEWPADLVKAEADAASVALVG